MDDELSLHGADGELLGAVPLADRPWFTRPSPSGRLIACSDGPTAVKVIDVVRGLSRRFDVGGAVDACWSPSGRRVALVDEQGATVLSP